MFVAVCVVALVRVLTASSPASLHHLDDAERAEVGAAAARLEPKWRIDSRHSFPEDFWSQDDDFSNTERRWVHGEAQRRHVPQSEVFRAIDEELRAHPPTPPRKASSSPCKPRPFYD